jgi:hypothetical protein
VVAGATPISIIQAAFHRIGLRANYGESVCFPASVPS